MGSFYWSYPFFPKHLLECVFLCYIILGRGILGFSQVSGWRCQDVRTEQDGGRRPLLACFSKVRAVFLIRGSPGSIGIGRRLAVCSSDEALSCGLLARGRVAFCSPMAASVGRRDGSVSGWKCVFLIMWEVSSDDDFVLVWLPNMWIALRGNETDDKGWQWLLSEDWLETFVRRMLFSVAWGWAPVLKQTKCRWQWCYPLWSTLPAILFPREEHCAQSIMVNTEGFFPCQKPRPPLLLWIV